MMASFTYLAAAPGAGDTDRYVVSVDMKVGAYTLANSDPGNSGARYVTCTRTVVGGADTAGTIVVVGKNLAGQTITETLTPGAHTILVTGTKLFASITSVTGAGWVTATGNDTIVVGMAAEHVIAEGGGVLKSIVLTETAASAITVSDASGTIAVLKASIAEGTYRFDLPYSGYLRVEPAGASKLTVVHTGSLPTEYAS
jgi:hypothetical protein